MKPPVLTSLSPKCNIPPEKPIKSPFWDTLSPLLLCAQESGWSKDQFAVLNVPHFHMSLDINRDGK